MDKRKKDYLSLDVLEFLEEEKYDIEEDKDKLLLIANSDTNRSLDEKLKNLRIKNLKNKINNKTNN